MAPGLLLPLVWSKTGHVGSAGRSSPQVEPLNVLSELPQPPDQLRKRDSGADQARSRGMIVGRQVWFHDPLKDRIFLGVITLIGHGTCQVLVANVTTRTVPWDRIRLRA